VGNSRIRDTFLLLFFDGGRTHVGTVMIIVGVR
jgi:hypothetical protein